MKDIGSGLLSAFVMYLTHVFGCIRLGQKHKQIWTDFKKFSFFFFKAEKNIVKKYL